MANGFKHIDSMYAYVVFDKSDNTEGIPSAFDPVTGQHFPLVGADMERAEQWRPMAEQIAKDMNATVTLVHFTTNRVEIARIGIPDAE